MIFRSSERTLGLLSSVVVTARESGRAKQALAAPPFQKKKGPDEMANVRTSTEKGAELMTNGMVLVARDIDDRLSVAVEIGMDRIDQ